MSGAGKAVALPPALSSAHIIARDHTLEDLLNSTSFAELQVRPAMQRHSPSKHWHQKHACPTSVFVCEC